MKKPVKKDGLVRRKIQRQPAPAVMLSTISTVFSTNPKTECIKAFTFLGRAS
jgi:hypothetical protein